MKIRGLLIIIVLALVIVYAIYFTKTGGKTNVKVMVDRYAEAKADLTKVNLATLEKIIVERNAAEGQVPADIQELQRVQPMPISTLDAWGREIRYEKLSDSSFRLTSSGADGRFGTGDDIVKEY
jgi:hypothetical protein